MSSPAQITRVLSRPLSRSNSQTALQQAANATAAMLAASKGSHTPLQLGPPAAPPAADSKSPAPNADTKTNGTHHHSSSSSSSLSPAFLFTSSSKSPLWVDLTVPDVVRMQSQPLPSASAASSFDQSLKVPLGRMESNNNAASVPSISSLPPLPCLLPPFILDAKCNGLDCSDRLCEACLSHTLDHAAAVYSRSASVPGSGDFVGLTDVVDFSIAIMKTLQQWKQHVPNASTVLALEDHTPIPVHSDASLVVDLSGTNALIPIDINANPSLTTVFEHFSSGIRRVSLFNSKQIQSCSSSSNFLGLISQASMLRFLIQQKCDLGSCANKSILELGLLKPAPTGFGHLYIEWCDTTMMQALTIWLMNNNQREILPSCPVYHKGAFVDVLAWYDLVYLLQNPKRSTFYQTVYEVKLKSKEMLRQALLSASTIASSSSSANGSRPPSAMKQHSSRRSSRGTDSGTLNVDGLMANPSSQPPSPSTESTLTVTFNLPPRRRKQRSIDLSTGNITSIITGSPPTSGSGFSNTAPVASSSSSSGTGAPGSSSSLNRIPLRKRSTDLTADLQDEFERVKSQLHHKESTPASKPPVPRLASSISKASSRDVSPEPNNSSSSMMISVAGLGSSSTISVNADSSQQQVPPTFLTRVPSSRRASLPTSRVEFSQLNLNSVAAPAQTITSPTGANSISPPSSSSSSSTTTVSSGGRSSRRSTGTSSLSVDSTASTLSNLSLSSSSSASSSSSTADYASGLSSRRGEGSITSISSRRSGNRTPSLDTSTPSSNAVSTASLASASSSAATPSGAAAVSVASRRAKRATMPTSLSASFSSSATVLPELLVNLDSMHHNVARMSVCNTSVLVQTDTTLYQAMLKMVEQHVNCLWMMNQQGRCVSYISATEVFQALLQHAPPSNAAPVPIKNKIISDYSNLNL